MLHCLLSALSLCLACVQCSPSVPSPSAGLSISEDSHQTTAHTPDWPLAPSERTGPHTPASHTPTESYARLAGGHRVYSAIGSNHISRDDEEDGDEVEGETLGPPDSLLSPLTAIKTNVPMSLMRSKLTSEKLRRKVINQSRRINRNFRMVGLLSEANTPNGPGVASEEAPVQGSIPGSRPTRHTPTRPPALLPGKSKKSSSTLPSLPANPSGRGQSAYEVFINEEDRDLPKKLFQVKSTMINDAEYTSQSLSHSGVSSARGRSSGLMFMLAGDGVDYEQPELSKFAMNAFSGELFLIAPLDRDPPTGRPVWRLVITAEDERGQRANGSVEVVVRVRDINDNAPRFEQDPYRANVSENQAAGADVVRVVAFDPDVDSIVRYSIEVNRVNSEGELIFDIDELSGQVSTAVCCLDRESIDQFSIKICATDEAISGDSRMHWAHSAPDSNQTCTSVLIDVTDENDQAPLFARDKFHLSLPDGVNELFPGRVLLNTSVADADLPQTNHFACRLSASVRPRHANRTCESTSLLPHFRCEVSPSGAVRLSLSDHFSPSPFHRSLLSEAGLCVGQSAAHWVDPVEVCLTLTVTDLGVFDVAPDQSVSLESHLAHAECLLRVWPHPPRANLTQESPSLVVVTKQILPNGYNGGEEGGEWGPVSLLASLRSLRLSPGRVATLALASLLPLLSLALVALLTRHRFGPRRAPAKIASAICCYGCGRGHGGNGTIDVAHSADSEGGSTVPLSPGLLFSPCSSHSSADVAPREHASQYRRLYGLTSDLSATPPTLNDSLITVSTCEPKYPSFELAGLKGDSAPAHLVLLDETLADSSRTNSTRFSDTSSCTGTTAYGLEINSPYDITLYDLAHLQLAEGRGQLLPLPAHCARHNPLDPTDPFEPGGATRGTTTSLAIIGIPNPAEVNSVPQTLPDVIHETGSGLC